MNKKQKEEWFKLFAEAFHEVIAPLLENMVTKDDLNAAVSKLENRFDKVDDRLDRHGKMLDEHEEKIAEVQHHLHLQTEF